VDDLNRGTPSRAACNTSNTYGNDILKITALQLNVGSTKSDNVQRTLALIGEAARKEQPDLIVVPELVTCMSAETADMHAAAEPFPDGNAYRGFRDAARTHKVNLHIGSMMEREGEKYYNCSVLFGRDGRQLGRYRKMHRSVLQLSSGPVMKESDWVDAGSEVIVVEVEGVKFGMSICFDLRFAELYRALADKGADVMLVPSAFKYETGAAHWEILLRARAIENQAYVVAAAQIGTYSDGQHRSYGHAMIVDPWGTVIAQVSDTGHFASATIDKTYLDEIQTRVPVRRLHVL